MRLARGEAVDQERVGLVGRAVYHGVQQAHRRQGRSNGKVRAVSEKQGHSVTAISQQSRLEHHVGSRNLRIAQHEEPGAVQLVAIQVERRINIGGHQITTSLVEDRNVAVEQGVGLAKQLHEFQAVRNGVAVGVDFIDEDLLGLGAGGSQKGRCEAQCRDREGLGC